MKRERDFAKLFDTKSSQVLVFVEYDDNTDETCLHQIARFRGVTSDMAFRFAGEDQEENAYEAFGRYTQDHADTYVKDVLVMLNERG